MTPSEFIEFNLGVSLTDEKILIHPDKLEKLMNDYAEHRITEAKASEVIRYSFSGRDFKDAVTIKEAHEAFQEQNTDKALAILVRANWSLLEAKKYINEHFEYPPIRG